MIVKDRQARGALVRSQSRVFYTGARAVLVTNWPVETGSAKVLTTDTFHRQATNPALSRAVALQQAMPGLIDGNGLVMPSKRPCSRMPIRSSGHRFRWSVTAAARAWRSVPSVIGSKEQP